MEPYEFYWRDGHGKDHSIGVLPERRKDPIRATGKSVPNGRRDFLAIRKAVAKGISFLFV
jgi:hypothetical protein